MSITYKAFGTTKDGHAITLYTISNTGGNSVSVMNYGAAIQAICIKDKSGVLTDCCLGYNTLAEYEAGQDYFGAFVGRVCNRIGGSHFVLNGKTYRLAANDGANHLHGGIKGFSQYAFEAAIKDDNTVIFTQLSPDMDEGYPGNLHISVSYTFDDENRLTIAYHAVSDADTPVSLTNHAYFNLSGESSGSIHEHLLTLNASAFTENDAANLPTGRILKVAGTPFDFRTAKTIGRDILADSEQLRLAGGYDHNFCIEGEGMRACAALYAADTGIQMDVLTDMPGVQIYSGNFIKEVMGKSGRNYHPRDGIAIETQYYPDSMAHPEFPSPILRAGQEYAKTTVYHFSVR